MSTYRRNYQASGCYFFTLVTHQRTPFFSTANNVQLFKSALKNVKNKRPFNLNAIVILPDHLHCLWHLPGHDTDYSTRWRLIKSNFSKQLTTSVNHRNEKPVWQRRFWEHTIRSEDDWRRHIEYIHYNPVKHGLVSAPKDWPHSSFHSWVKRGAYDISWGSSEAITFDDIPQAE